MAKKSKKTVDYVQRSINGVTMRLYFNEDKNRKYGSIKFDGIDFTVHICVYENKDGDYFVSYPSYQNSDGEYVNTAFPTSKDMYDLINKLAVKCIDEYYE